MRRLTHVRRRRTNPIGLVVFAVLALALAMGADVASAQTGTIVGTITDQATKAPVPSVQVQIVGTTRGVITGADGHYRLPSVASGPTQLRATRIGYAAVTQTISVPTGDVATVDFALAATQITLDQVVVTGTQETERERESGNLVAVIATDSINKGAVSTFSDLIAAKAAGVDITQSSGEVGSSARIRIRGSNSISLSNDPLLVIDGVFVDNGTASLSTGIFTGGQTISRFDDLNPGRDRERGDLEGPVGVGALWRGGGQRCHPGDHQEGCGRPRRVDVPRRLRRRVQRGGLSRQLWTGRYHYRCPPGSETTGCTLIDQAGGACSPVADSLLNWNPLMSSLYSPFRKGNDRYAFGGSVAGGSDVTKYFVSGDFNNEYGMQPNNFQTRNNGRANLQATPTSKIDFSH